MLTMLRTYLQHQLGDEEGATAVEYGLLVALIAVAIIVAVGAVGEGLDGIFTEVADELSAGED